MSWLSSALKDAGIKLDSHTLGNLVKNLSPVAGTIIGGPLGLAAAGGLSALGDLGRGKNIGQALKGGVENAGLAGAGEALGGLAGYHGGLGALTGGGSESAAGATGGATGGAAGAAGSAPIAGAPTAASFESAAPSTGGLSSVNIGGISMPAPTAAALPASPGWAQSLASGGGSSGGLLSKVGDLAGAAAKNPLATAGVLQGLGGIASSGSENRVRNAQANALETQTALSANELAQRQKSQTALAPYWSALASQGSSQPPVPGDPYLPKAGA